MEYWFLLAGIAAAACLLFDSSRGKREEKRKIQERIREYNGLKRSIHFQQLVKETGYEKSDMPSRGMLKNRPQLRMDFPPIDVRTEEVINLCGSKRTRKCSRWRQRSIKRVLMKIYPDRLFWDDLNEWNSYISPEERAAKEQAAKERAAREQAARERAAKERAAAKRRASAQRTSYWDYLIIRELKNGSDRSEREDWDCDHDDHDGCEDYEDCGCDCDAGED